MAIEDFQADPWKNPQWMLLSCGKTMTASSAEEGKGAEKAAEENVQTWWRAASAQPGEWLQMDLGKAMDVRAIQINFADDKIDIEPPKPLVGNMTGKRYIEERNLITRWKLEGSLDGDNYFMIEDKSDAKTDLPHDMVVREDGIQVRYLETDGAGGTLRSAGCHQRSESIRYRRRRETGCADLYRGAPRRSGHEGCHYLR